MANKKVQDALAFFAHTMPRFAKILSEKAPNLLTTFHTGVQGKRITIKDLQRLGEVYLGEIGNGRKPFDAHLAFQNNRVKKVGSRQTVKELKFGFFHQTLPTWIKPTPEQIETEYTRSKDAANMTRYAPHVLEQVMPPEFITELKYEQALHGINKPHVMPSYPLGVFSDVTYGAGPGMQVFETYKEPYKTALERVKDKSFWEKLEYIRHLQVEIQGEGLVAYNAPNKQAKLVEATLQSHSQRLGKVHTSPEDVAKAIRENGGQHSFGQPIDSATLIRHPGTNTLVVTHPEAKQYEHTPHPGVVQHLLTREAEIKHMQLWRELRSKLDPVHFEVNPGNHYGKVEHRFAPHIVIEIKPKTKQATEFLKRVK